MISIIERIFRLIGQAMQWVVKIPFELWHEIFVRQQYPQDAAVEQAAQQAEIQTSLHEAQAEARAEAREALRALKKVAGMRANGIHLDPTLIGKLPKCHVDYLLALKTEECDQIGKFPLSSVKALLLGDKPVGGVRSCQSLRTGSGKFAEVPVGRAPESRMQIMDIKDRLELLRRRKAVLADKADDVLASMGMGAC
jgi:hypothetical protein